MKPANKFALKFFAIFFGVIVLFVLMCVAMVKIGNESTESAQQAIAQEQRENAEAIKNHHALIGMTAAQVRQSWGEPTRVVRTLDEQHTYEEWTCGRRTSLYFVDGIFKSGTRSDGK